MIDDEVTLLLERATDDLPLDANRVVAGALADGARRRRRQRFAGAATAAAVVVAGAGCAAVLSHGGSQRPTPAPPTRRELRMSDTEFPATLARLLPGRVHLVDTDHPRAGSAAAQVTWNGYGMVVTVTDALVDDPGHPRDPLRHCQRAGRGCRAATGGGYSQVETDGFGPMLTQVVTYYTADDWVVQLLVTNTADPESGPILARVVPLTDTQMLAVVESPDWLSR